jgi:hypothetical protein
MRVLPNLVDEKRESDTIHGDVEEDDEESCIKEKMATTSEATSSLSSAPLRAPRRRSTKIVTGMSGLQAPRRRSTRIQQPLTNDDEESFIKEKMATASEATSSLSSAPLRAPRRRSTKIVTEMSGLRAPRRRSTRIQQPLTNIFPATVEGEGEDDGENKPRILRRSSGISVGTFGSEFDSDDFLDACDDDDDDDDDDDGDQAIVDDDDDQDFNASAMKFNTTSSGRKCPDAVPI